MTAPADPLRRLAAERGRLMGELGVRPSDSRWASLEAETIAGLVAPRLFVGLPVPVRVAVELARFLRRLRRSLR